MYAYSEKEGLVSDADCGPNVLASSAKADIKNLDSFWFRVWARLWRFNQARGHLSMCRLQCALHQQVSL